MIALLFVQPREHASPSSPAGRAALEIFGVSKYVSVPIAALVVWLLVVRGSYNSVEKIFLFFTLIYVTYVISGFLAKPDWGLALHQTLVPPISPTSSYWVMLVGVDRHDDRAVDAVLPAVRRRGEGHQAEGLPGFGHRRRSSGCIITDVVALFIIVACAATLHVHGITIQTRQGRGGRARAARRQIRSRALRHRVRERLAVRRVDPAAVDRVHASPRVSGWERGVNHSFREAPQFNWIYTS